MVLKGWLIFYNLHRFLWSTIESEFLRVDWSFIICTHPSDQVQWNPVLKGWLIFYNLHINGHEYSAKEVLKGWLIFYNLHLKASMKERFDVLKGWLIFYNLHFFVVFPIIDMFLRVDWSFIICTKKYAVLVCYSS